MHTAGVHQSLRKKNTNFMTTSQPLFRYDNAFIAVFEKCLSSDRLASYYAIAKGDRLLGIQLHERNTELSEALYGVIQGLEVTLRNAVHNIMITKLGTPTWYDIFEWEESERNAIQEAKAKISLKSLPLTPGRIVSELTFGFWVKLTASPYERKLWFSHLHPIVPPTVRRKPFHGRLMEFKTLRNRIAHHERIIGRARDLPTEYQNIIEVIGWLNPEIQSWVKHKNCFTERYSKPLKKSAKSSVGNPVAVPK